MMNRKRLFHGITYVIFAVFIAWSFATGQDEGQAVWGNFTKFALTMLKLLPPAFVLIGLFDVWVSREMIENNFGRASGPMKYVWSVLLAATTVGGTFVAFPVAHALHGKGARFSAVLAYVSAASLVMVPMTIIEASILGIKFSLVRLAISIPLVVLSSSLMGRYLEHRGYQLPHEGDKQG
jgi:uncharacterized membrane protein YraQ (UPF0718 family)